MKDRILATEKVVVNRRESSFDRACDEAYNLAVMMLGIDDSGHSTRVKKWDRSTCFIRVVFESYEHVGSMGGGSHKYTFRAEAVREGDDE